MGTVANYFMALAKKDDEPYPTVSLRKYPKAAEGAEHFATYKCQQCHPAQITADAPSADQLAPNLAMASGRLRPDWIEVWLRDPQSQMPGTRMPSFFYDDGEYFFDTAPEEIEALRDYLMTLSP